MPAVEAFDALPYLQIFVGGITLLVSVWMMVQAQRDKKSLPDHKPMPDGQQMMLQGLTSLRELVHDIRNLNVILAAIDLQHRRLQDQISVQTHSHLDAMRDMQSTADAILHELRRR